MPRLPLVFSGPFVGLNLKKDASRLNLGEALVAKNVILDKGTILKREGWESVHTFSSSGTVCGLFNWVQNNGTVVQILKQDGYLWKCTDLGGTPSVAQLGSQDFHASNLADAAIVNNRIYICDGTGFKVTDGTTTYAPQIPRPSSAPTVTAVANGIKVLTGDYDYKYSYYSSTWGQESPSSNASAVVSPDGQDVQLTDWDISTCDARVDKFRIYRRRIDTNESEWRLVTEIAKPGNTTDIHEDDEADNDLSNLYNAPLSYSTALPNMSFMTYQNGVLFMVSKTSPDRIYVSMPGRPWVVTYFLTVEGTDGQDTEAITGLAAFQGVVVVFKENSIWILSGDDVGNFRAQRVVSHVGCRSHHSIQCIDNLIYFLSEEGIFAFDGANATEISRPVQPLLLDRNFSRDAFCISTHDYENNALIWSFASAGETTNDTTIVFFYRNTAETQMPSWAQWEFNDTPSFYSLVSDATTKKRSVGIGWATKEFGLYGGVDDDDGNDITFQWKTGKTDYMAPTRNKRWGLFVAEFAKQTSYSSILVRGYRNSDTQSFIIGPMHNMQEPIFRRRLKRWSRDLSIEFYQDSQTPLEIIGWRIEAEIKGKA